MLWDCFSFKGIEQINTEFVYKTEKSTQNNVEKLSQTEDWIVELSNFATQVP